MHSAFSDYESVIKDEIAEGYEVVVRYKSRGTLRGIFPVVSPTGRQVSFTRLAIRRGRQKIVERWNEADTMGLMRCWASPPPPDDAQT